MNEHARIIEDAAQKLGTAIGVSVAEAEYQIEKAINSLNGFQVPVLDIAGLHQAMERIEEQRRQQQWATDPLGLMDWLELDQWRWFIVNRIGNIQDALSAIAEWIEPDRFGRP